MATLSPASEDHRRAEMEDWANRRVFHPLARSLARAVRPLGITPNMLSVAGLLCIVAAAVSYTAIAWPAGALAGFAFHLLWHVADGADGDLARLTGKASFAGEFVDGVCDYMGHVVLYVSLAASLAHDLGIWAWLLATAAGGAHIAQTNFAETLRRSYLWLAYGKPWLKQATGASDASLGEPSWFNFTFGWMLSDYLRLASALSPRRSALDRLAEQRAGGEAFREAIRARAPEILRFTPYLGANVRTFLLGASMLLGSPLWFFLGECIPLTLVLVLAVRHRRRVSEQLEAQFGMPAD